MTWFTGVAGGMVCNDLTEFMESCCKLVLCWYPHDHFVKKKVYLC